MLTALGATWETNKTPLPVLGEVNHRGIISGPVSGPWPLPLWRSSPTMLPSCHELNLFAPSCPSTMAFLPWRQPTTNWIPWSCRPKKPLLHYIVCAMYLVAVKGRWLILGWREILTLFCRDVVGVKGSNSSVCKLLTDAHFLLIFTSTSHKTQCPLGLFSWMSLSVSFCS